MGCLRADGRERLLENYLFQTGDSTTAAAEAAVAGVYAALVTVSTDPHYGGSSETVKVFDLGTGSQDPGRGGESNTCEDYNYSCFSAMDNLVLNSEGFTAVRAWRYGSAAPSSEQIIASDSRGVRVLDSAPAQETARTFSHVRLSGNTLTWNRDGTSETAALG